MWLCRAGGFFSPFCDLRDGNGQFPLPGARPCWRARGGCPLLGMLRAAAAGREGGSSRRLCAASAALQDNAVPFVFLSGVPISSSAVLGPSIVLMGTAAGSCPCVLASLPNTVDQLYCRHCTCPIRKGLNLAETCETYFNSNVSILTCWHTAEPAIT